MREKLNEYSGALEEKNLPLARSITYETLAEAFSRYEKSEVSEDTFNEIRARFEDVAEVTLRKMVNEGRMDEHDMIAYCGAFKSFMKKHASIDCFKKVRLLK